MIKIWLDDMRLPPDGWVWAKTADEAIRLLKAGDVEEISLDHDLGHSHYNGFEEEKTGYTVAKFIEEGAVNGTLPEMDCYIHTQNVVGRENIKAALRSAYVAWKTR